VLGVGSLTVEILNANGQPATAAVPGPTSTEIVYVAGPRAPPGPPGIGEAAVVAVAAQARSPSTTPIRTLRAPGPRRSSSSSSSTSASLGTTPTLRAHRERGERRGHGDHPPARGGQPGHGRRHHGGERRGVGRPARSRSRASGRSDEPAGAAMGQGDAAELGRGDDSTVLRADGHDPVGHETVQKTEPPVLLGLVSFLLTDNHGETKMHC
jgi:hypothetical protein